jgi:hypothetical protein
MLTTAYSSMLLGIVGHIKWHEFIKEFSWSSCAILYAVAFTKGRYDS